MPTREGMRFVGPVERFGMSSGNRFGKPTFEEPLSIEINHAVLTTQYLETIERVDMTSLKQFRLLSSLVATFTVVLFLFSASLSSAQTQPTVLTTLQNASSVAVPGYISLSLDEGSELRVGLSDVQARSSSPMYQTVGLKQRQPEPGFQAVHADTGLTEIVDYYRNTLTLTELGFGSLVETISRYGVVYAFEKGDHAMTAVFTQQDDSVAADLSWIVYDGMKLSGHLK